MGTEDTPMYKPCQPPNTGFALNLVARVLGDPLDTLVNVLGQIDDAGINELLLIVGDLANGVNLLHTVGAKFNVGCEIGASLLLEERALDEGGLNNTLFTLASLEQRLGEAGTGHGHGQGSRSGTGLGLDDLVTTELDAVDVLVKGLSLEAVAGLGEKGDDSDAGVTANNGDRLGGGVGSLDFRDEARGADHVEGSYTEETFGVIDAARLEHLGSDGDGGVNLENQYIA